MPVALKVNTPLQKDLADAYAFSARRTVLVTGGTHGIGPAICRKMADLGHFVAVTYRDEARARVWQDEMEKKGYLFFIYKDEASDPEESRNLAEAVAEDLGPIHILVNNVVNDDPGSFPYITRAVIEDMLEDGYGRVVNITSGDGQDEQLDQASYAAVRADMHEFTKVLAQASARKGVTVNTISSGYVENSAVLATPEDVAHAVSFLVAEESGFITGANISADGGYFME